MEFCLSDQARLSIAYERGASVESCSGRGIPLALETEDIELLWNQIRQKGLAPTQIRDHAWGARVFYFFDPEGHRIEIWQNRQ